MKGRTRRMRKLHFVSGGNKLTAIPKTTCGFAGEKIDTTSDNTHYPPGNVVDFSKIHSEVDLHPFFGTGKNSVSIVDLTGSLQNNY